MTTTYSPADPHVTNPGDVDTALPHRRIKLTEKQADEMYHRLSVTAETPDLTDWGWIERTGRTTYYLCVVEGRQVAAAGTYSGEGTIGDIENCLDIAEDQAHHAWGAEGQGFVRSMETLLAKVRAEFDMDDR